MSASAITLDDLRRFAVARSLFPPTTLQRAIARMGFVQADPIRAPARAQDLILRHRVKGYRTGDLERRYASLSIAEDVFVNYGYVTRAVQGLMHPRPDLRVPAEGNQSSSAVQREKEQMLLEFVEKRGVVHPHEVEEHFAHGTVRITGAARHMRPRTCSTRCITAGCYGWRDARTASGFTAQRHGPESLDETARRARIDALVDVAVNIYAPLPAASLSFYVRRLRYAVPQWQDEITGA